NIFLDAFTHKHNQTATLPWISVNWDTWRVRADQETSTTLGETVAEYAMSAEEGVEALTRILAAKNITHIVDSTGDLQARIRQWVMLDSLTEDDAEELRSAGAINRAPASVSTSGDYEQKVT